MRYNALGHRWEVWHGDRLVGWITAEASEDHIRYWYRRLLKLVYGL